MEAVELELLDCIDVRSLWVMGRGFELRHAPQRDPPRPKYSQYFPPARGADRVTWVETRGLEPLTPCLQSRCATNCATSPGSEQPRSDRVGRFGPESSFAPTLAPLSPRRESGQRDQQQDNDSLQANLRMPGSVTTPGAAVVRCATRQLSRLAKLTRRSGFRHRGWHGRNSADDVRWRSDLLGVARPAPAVTSPEGGPAGRRSRAAGRCRAEADHLGTMVHQR